MTDRMELQLVARDCCAWPVLTRRADGALLLVHFNRPSHGLQEGDLVALSSTDDGITWTDAGTPAPHDPGTNRMHLAAGCDHGGEWIVLSTGFRFAGAAWAGLDALWCSHSTPPGTNWCIRRQVQVESLESWLIPHGRVHALGDGRLAAVFYHADGPRGPSRAWLAFSRDHGDTWHETTPLGDSDTNEVVVLPRPVGPWLAVARTQLDHHLVLWRSKDEGRSWTSPTPITESMQHPGDLTALDGEQVVLTYGIRNRGKTGIGARLSTDGGETWGPPVVLARFENATDCGYPSTVRGKNGQMLTACYTNASTVAEGYHLLLIRWRLDRLHADSATR